MTKEEDLHNEDEDAKREIWGIANTWQALDCIWMVRSDLWLVDTRMSLKNHAKMFNQKSKSSHECYFCRRKSGAKHTIQIIYF